LYAACRTPADAVWVENASKGECFHEQKILVVLSEWGYWGEELVGPLEAFEEAATPSTHDATGKRPVAIGSAWIPTTSIRRYGRSVTLKEMGEKVARVRLGRHEQRARQPDEPLALMPERRTLEDNFLPGRGYYKERDEKAKTLPRLLRRAADLRGSGRSWIWSTTEAARPDPRFYDADKLNRRGVTASRASRSRAAGGSQVDHLRQHVTGHCIEYDYKYGRASWARTS